MKDVIFDNTEYQYEDNEYSEEFDFQEYVEKPMEELLEKKDVVMRCNLGLWDGTCEGGGIISTMKDFWRMFEDCETCKIEETEEGLKIEVNHHDGTNYYMLRVLTDEGWDYNRQNEDILTDRELHTNLWDEQFSSPLVLSE